jgi:hypothetical protein
MVIVSASVPVKLVETRANVAIAPDIWSAVAVWVWVVSFVEPPAVDESQPTAIPPRPEFAHPNSPT